MSKKIYNDLVKKYCELGLFVPVLTIRQNKGQMMAKKHMERASVLWQVTNDSGKHDDKLAMQKIEDEQDRISKMLYGIAWSIIKNENRLDLLPNQVEQNRMSNDHLARFHWCFAVGLELELIQVYDTIMNVDLTDEESTALGAVRRLADKD